MYDLCLLLDAGCPYFVLLRHRSWKAVRTSETAKKTISTSVLPDVLKWVPQLPEWQTLGFQEKIWERGVICPSFFPLGCMVLRFSAIFFLVGLAKPNRTWTLLEEVTITYFHSTPVFCNLKTKFLSWTNLQYSCIFEQFALENLYNGCLPMDHEKHRVTLSVKHKRNIYRSDGTFQKDLLI